MQLRTLTPSRLLQHENDKKKKKKRPSGRFMSSLLLDGPRE